MRLSQTSIIAGSMIVAYIVFVTISGELPCYLQVLGIGTGAGGNCPSNVAGPNLYGGPGTATSASFTSSSGPAIGVNLGGGAGGGSIGIGPIRVNLPPINLPPIGGGGGFGGFGGFGG